MAEKIGVLRRRYTQGYNREQIVGLYRFIDWVMALPPELERRFLDDVEAWETENKMPYITSAERLEREEGLREGLLAGIELGLRLKFGPASEEIVPEIRQLTDLAIIREVHARIETAGTIDDVRRLYR